MTRLAPALALKENRPAHFLVLDEAYLSIVFEDESIGLVPLAQASDDMSDEALIALIDTTDDFSK